MLWKDEWKTISAQVKGLVEASKIHFGSLPVTPDVARRTLNPFAKEIARDVKGFGLRSKAVLPSSATRCLEEFSQFFDDDKNFHINDSDLELKARVSALVSFVAKFDHLLSDFSEAIARISERAFTHLQRLIVVDRSIRAEWQKAFDRHETQCEKLGAVHLLSHGIWAFKAQAEGERTDLVFQEPLVLSEVERSAHGLVLTEWKLVKGRTVEKAAKKAYKQAKLYTHGSLAGIELTKYRYLVLVSRNREEMPEDFTEGDVIYRHINIAVDPMSPSRDAQVKG